MGKLAGKDIDWLLNAKQQYEEGLPTITDPKRRELIQVGLDAVLDEIKLRNQKKSESQPVQKQETVPEKPAQQNTTPPQAESQKQSPVQHPPKSEHKAAKVEPVLISSNVLTKVPPPTIPVRWANGEIREMAELELRRKAIDYFCDVLDSNFDTSNFYRSMQFNNCVRFLIGLYRFGNGLLPHLVLHSTFNNCGNQTKIKSIELYNQIKANWEKFKDKDL